MAQFSAMLIKNTSLNSPQSSLDRQHILISLLNPPYDQASTKCYAFGELPTVPALMSTGDTFCDNQSVRGSISTDDTFCDAQSVQGSISTDDTFCDAQSVQGSISTEIDTDHIGTGAGSGLSVWDYRRTTLRLRDQRRSEAVYGDSLTPVIFVKFSRLFPLYELLSSTNPSQPTSQLQPFPTIYYLRYQPLLNYRPVNSTAAIDHLTLYLSLFHSVDYYRTYGYVYGS
ncbi:hypothetical protein L211DRAFT_851754 [Terfezia boudieri ATCC MYA-4762]|uniref:Uncharacterized protein n=1 Tax=Terfezia boudieri ATCC MYA-4762 TaxID=1051890 RepID=A0A3N4LT25_9PEZI|nr:hypothetical protein L211DRAFT_851754 [Terfezia boudieri ATCC MYA-4762]